MRNEGPGSKKQRLDSVQVREKFKELQISEKKGVIGSLLSRILGNWVSTLDNS